MRKFLSLLLSLFFLFPSSAFADATTLYQSSDTSSQSLSFMNVFSLPDTFYIFAYNTSTYEAFLYSYHPGDDALTSCASHLYHARGVTTFQAAQDACEENMSRVPLYQMPDLRYAISDVGTDGERLYAINHLNGLIFAMEVTEEGVVFEDVVQMDVGEWFVRELEQADGDVMEELCMPEVLSVSDGKMACLCRGAMQDDLLLISLLDGSVEQVDLGEVWVYEAAAGAPGEIVLSLYDRNVNGMSLYRMQMADGEMTCFKQDVSSYAMRGLAWNAQEESYWVTNGVAIQSTKDFDVYTTRGSLPRSGMSLAVAGEKLIAYQRSRVYVRTISDEAQEQLTLMLRQSDGAYEAIQEFSERNVDVILDVQQNHRGTKNEVTSALEDGTVDLLLLGEDAREVQPWLLDELLDSGNCRELSDMPEVVKYMESVHPVFRSAVMRDGKLYGIVRAAYSTSGYNINRLVQEEMRLMEDDLPTNLVDLCAFITKWNNEYVTQYPSYVPLDSTEDYHARIFDLMVWEWIGYCQASDIPLTFDHPIFRQMLDALAAMDSSEIEKANQVVNEEESDYRMPLILTGVYTVGDFSNYTTASGDRTLIPMTLTADTPFLHAITELEVVLCSANTDNTVLAERMLNEIITTMPEVNQHILITGCTSGVERSGYSSLADTYETSLAALKRQMEKAPTSRKLYFADQIAHMEAEYHYFNGQIRWSIAPKTVELYQEVILPACYLRRPSVVEVGDTREAFNKLCNAYLRGDLSIDAFIEEGNLLLEK